ncbi:MAG: CinA family protein, partial [Candidatus Heimdallarchaeota archaeon]
MSFEERLQELASEILSEFTTRGMTLAIAESCTGGLATSLLTDLEGCSEILSFSIVTYSTDAKEEF